MGANIGANVNASIGANASNANSSRRLLDCHELAEYLGVTVGWVRDHSNGKREPQIPSFKVGKFRKYRMHEIERWLKRHSEAAVVRPTFAGDSPNVGA